MSNNDDKPLSDQANDADANQRSIKPRRQVREVTGKVKKYYDSLVASLTPDTARFVREAVTRARARRSAHQVVKTKPGSD
jgi:hypothetical protein